MSATNMQAVDIAESIVSNLMALLDALQGVVAVLWLLLLPAAWRVPNSVWLDVAGGAVLQPSSPHRSTIQQAAITLPQQLESVPPPLFLPSHPSFFLSPHRTSPHLTAWLVPPQAPLGSLRAGSGDQRTWR